jgi:hypothetical protein
VCLGRRDDAGSEVADWADLERDVPFGEVRDERRVLGGGDAVPDPLGVEQFQRRPDGLGAGRLAGVGDGVETGRASGGKSVLEEVGRTFDLVPAQSETDHAVRRRQRRDPLDRLHDRAGTRLGVADAVGNPAQLDAELGAGAVAAGVHAVELVADREAALAGVRLGVEVGLDVAAVLPRRLGGELVGDLRKILRRAKAGAGGNIDVDKVGEVAERVEGGQRGVVVDRQVQIVPGREGAHRRREDAAFEVDVDLDLRHAADEFGQPPVPVLKVGTA